IQRVINEKLHVGVNRKMEIQIVNTWDGEPVNHDPMVMSLRPHPEGLGLQLGVTAPFFNDPPAPHSDPGQPCHQLWDYEVVEMFFLNDQMEKYLEVELCPHGQHLVLLLDGRRKIWKDDLLLDFEVMPLEDECNGVRRWQGHALVPWRYLPPGVCKFNAYAIHGSGEARVYEAFFPVPKHKVQPGMQPDFHRLEYFGDLDLPALMGNDWIQPDSEIWSARL
uniref:Chromosome 4 open reading frame 33 n=1 Tax=Petromyzon marinus TaxID=7757 RepID=S4R9F3_PETMA